MNMFVCKVARWVYSDVVICIIIMIDCNRGGESQYDGGIRRMTAISNKREGEKIMHAEVSECVKVSECLTQAPIPERENKQHEMK